MGDLFGLKPMIEKYLWAVELDSLPRWRVWLIVQLRLHYAIGRDLARGGLSVRAMSLVYTTLLSLVPLLAISFSVLKGFGVHNQIEPLLLSLLEPLGAKSADVTGQVIQYVEQINVGVLGSVGLGFLVYTVISLMQKIEQAFNHIWYVSRHRSIARRFADYISVLVVGPLLIFASMGLTTIISNELVAGVLGEFSALALVAKWGGLVIPYLLAVGAFACFFMFMPNTAVRARSALIGALVAALLWKGMGWLFATFVAGSAKYAEVYSVFATPLLFMIWLYLAWMVMFIGASISFYDQNPAYLRIRRDSFHMSGRLSERLALHIAYQIAVSFHGGGKAWSAGGLAARMGLPTLAVEQVVDELERCGLIARTSDEPPAYLPARPLESIAVIDVLAAVRERGEREHIAAEVLPREAAVDRVAAMVEEGATRSVQGLTLRDLATDSASAPLAPVTDEQALARARR